MKKILLVILIFLCLLFSISCKEDNQEIPEDKKKDKQETIEDKYFVITFTDYDDSIISTVKVKEGEEVTYPSNPTRDRYTFIGWSLDVKTVSADITIKAQYEIVKEKYKITYMVTDEDWICKSKEEVVNNFLSDFYDFVSPKESRVAFLYGIQGGEPSWYNYIGGSVGPLNYLLKDNNLELDDDNYFFNSSKYKEKWMSLGVYVRDKVCGNNKRFGNPDNSYTYGALDFKRYIIGDPDKYLATYGGEEVFYGYPIVSVIHTDYYWTGPLLSNYLKPLPSHLFQGWYKDKELTEEVNVYESGDLVLYPKYSTERLYDISFATDSEITPIKVKKGDTVTLPSISKPECEFQGWYLDFIKMPDEFVFNYDTSIELTPKFYYNDRINKEYLVYDDKVITYKGSLVGVEIPTEYEEKDGMRACWVSSFINSYKPSSNKSEMMRELLFVLDTMDSFNMNCVIFHIRTHNNAFYKTNLAPIKPEYGTYATFEEWDYLTWFIEECHKRGIEFHAWLNPYRIDLSGLSSNATTEDVASRFKDYPLNPASKAENILMTYNSDGKPGSILNPAKDEVINYLVDVCLEIIENYDVDGIHFDDYFYHRLSEDKNVLHDADQDDYEAYIDNNDTSYKKDDEEDKLSWRRDNVNRLVKAIHDSIVEYNKENNRSVVFGISPTGVYRSGDGSAESGSLTTGGGHYNKYTLCDSVYWIKNGYVDYIMPQCYTSFDNPDYYFHEITSWWNKVVAGTNVKLYIGMSISKAVNSSYDFSWRTQERELINQLLYLETLENVEGVCFFSFTSLKTILDSVDNIAKDAFRILKEEMWINKVNIPK